MDITVGTIIRLKTFCMDNKAGTFGICYEVYQGLPAILFPNKRFDLFTTTEQKTFLEVYKVDLNLATYNTKGITNVLKDFDDGVFDNALSLRKSNLKIVK